MHYDSAWNWNGACVILAHAEKLPNAPMKNAIPRLAVLLLAVIGLAVGSVSAQTAGTQRTPTITTAVASGAVPAGTRKLTFIFSSDFTGTVLGAAFTGASDASVTIDAPAGDTLGEVAYTVTSGSIRIVAVQ